MVCSTSLDRLTDAQSLCATAYAKLCIPCKKNMTQPQYIAMTCAVEVRNGVIDVFRTCPNRKNHIWYEEAGDHTNTKEQRSQDLRNHGLYRKAQIQRFIMDTKCDRERVSVIDVDPYGVTF